MDPNLLRGPAFSTFDNLLVGLLQRKLGLPFEVLVLAAGAVGGLGTCTSCI